MAKLSLTPSPLFYNPQAIFPFRKDYGITAVIVLYINFGFGKIGKVLKQLHDFFRNIDIAIFTFMFYWNFQKISLLLNYSVTMF